MPWLPRSPTSWVVMFGFGLEYFAKFCHTVVCEGQCRYPVARSTIYQESVEAVTGQVFIRALAAVPRTLCLSMDGLDCLQR